ncbi:MAG: transcriptional regulator [Planktothrix sp. GU0601_MAG3]|nr:MAG: transcriptional regulator [Planktothrix sp. GU0601_MAG3]
MTSTKLSESEKQEIIRLYQDVPEETTITLAERYGVSSSTVRRVLQSAVPKDVYDLLTTQKQRLHRLGKRSLEDVVDGDESQGEVHQETPEPVSRESTLILPRKRKQSSAFDQEVLNSTPSDSPGPDSLQISLSNYQLSIPGLEGLFSPDRLEVKGHAFGDYDADEDIQEDGEDSNSDPRDGEDEEDEEDYGDEFTDDQDDDDTEPRGLFSPALASGGSVLVKILPLTETVLPRTCYLVIDRFSELIAKPLKTFSELGTIPEEEILEQTLPVFDNHRIASRFSGRNQRVFKVPDGRLLRKAAPYLQAKGITRLLIDGQVYRF